MRKVQNKYRIEIQKRDRGTHSMKWCKRWITRNAMVFFQLMPKLLNNYLHTNFFLKQFWALKLFLCKHICEADTFWWKSKQKSKTCKVWNASCRFWKIYNFQIFGRSTDRTGRGREVDALVGFPWKHTNIWNIFNTYSSHKYVKDYLSQIFWRYSLVRHVLFLFFPMPMFLWLDLYLRFLSKNEYLGLNCMWWR